MLIDDIIPYERNARNNDKAVAAVAESIKQFGLRGQIVLESPDNPVIVAGHTRVKAMKSLGWTEVPDSKIDYCEDLTDDQIRAYRLADNRTSEKATWKTALVKTEVASLEGNIDMSRFNFEHKTKRRGATRMRTDDYYNLPLVSAMDCDEYGMPIVAPCDCTPSDLLPFNYAKSAKSQEAFIHFFIDDYQFERIWNSPERYLELFRKFPGMLAPDFSLYMDMPLPMQMWNEYRRRALTHFYQRHGVEVVPTLSWTDERSYGFCFNGLPNGSTYATATVGVARSPEGRQTWAKGMKVALEALEPKRLLIYGAKLDFQFPCEVIYYDRNTTHRERADYGQ